MTEDTNTDIFLDQEFVNALIRSGDEGFRLLKQSGFRREFLKDREFAEVYDFAMKFHRDFGEFPHPDIVAKNFGRSVVREARQNLTYQLDQLRKRNVLALAGQFLNYAIPILDNPSSPSDIYEGIDNVGKMLLETAQKITLETSNAHTVDITKNTSDRLEAYAEMQNKGGVTGVPTPWPTLTRVTRGFQPGHTYLFSAPTNTGKTFILNYLALYAYDKDYTPLLFTQEMSAQEMAFRYDAMKAKIPYGRLISGELEPEEFSRWQAHLQALEEKKAALYVTERAGHKGLDFLKAEAKILKPRLILIDNIYLFCSGLDYKDIKKFSIDLKNWAQDIGVPIVFCTQLNSEGALAYSKQIEEDVSGHYMVTDPGYMAGRYFTDKKARDAKKGSKWAIHFDMENMNFTEIDGYDFDSSSQESGRKDDPLQGY